MRNPDQTPFDTGGNPPPTSSREPRDLFVQTLDGPGSKRRIALHVLEWPSTAPSALLLLHGGGAHARWWGNVAPLFLADFRVFALDLRGHGDSDHAPGHYRFESLAEDLALVIERVAPGADIIGASMGGQVALLAAAMGVAMRRLILVDVPPRPPANVVDRRSLFGTPKIYPSREEALRRFRVIPSETSASPSILAEIARHSIRPLGDGRYRLKFDHRMFAAPPREPPPDLLERVRVPTLLLRGEKSDILDAATAGEMARRIADCRLVTIPQAGHHLFLDNTEAFVEAVKGFLAAKRED